MKRLASGVLYSQMKTEKTQEFAKLENFILKKKKARQQECSRAFWPSWEHPVEERESFRKTDFKTYSRHTKEATVIKDQRYNGPTVLFILEQKVDINPRQGRASALILKGYQKKELRKGNLLGKDTFKSRWSYEQRDHRQKNLKLFRSSKARSMYTKFEQGVDFMLS